MTLKCELCPHKCQIKEGQTGFCHARTNKDGKIIAKNYGHITSMALDPIEKKPLYHFYPGSKILSIGSYGCNLRCSFCQNHDISMNNGEDKSFAVYSPKEIVDRALYYKSMGNIGIAYTYNEPLISYEFVKDCAKLAKENKLKNVVVTNGVICREPLEEILPYIDAFNIDLKGFTNEFYKWVKGDLETVKETIKLASKHAHVEVTTLIIPGKNDSEEEIEKLSSWLASIDQDIPYFINRFYPRWKLSDLEATPAETLNKLVKIAKRQLKNVW